MSAIFGELLNYPQEQGPEVRLRVFGDERYADVRHLFRRTRTGLEALFHSMELRKPG